MTPLEIIRGWISTGALIGLLTLASRLWVQNRRLTMQGKVDDRQGFGALIDALTKDIDRLRARVETLETEKDRDHRLIMELLGQLNRTQAASILASQNISPELRGAMDAIVGLG